MLWGGWRERKRERAGHASSPARFLFFDYCYFYRDTQREPLRRRENQRRCAFVSVQQKKSNRPISVRLLFLFWSRVFISRSYENNSRQPLFQCCMVSNLILPVLIFWIRTKNRGIHLTVLSHYFSDLTLVGRKRTTADHNGSWVVGMGGNGITHEACESRPWPPLWVGMFPNRQTQETLNNAPPWDPTPYPFAYYFWQKRCAFRIPFIDIHSLESSIPFNCCECAVV